MSRSGQHAGDTASVSLTEPAAAPLDTLWARTGRVAYVLWVSMACCAVYRVQRACLASVTGMEHANAHQDFGGRCVTEPAQVLPSRGRLAVGTEPAAEQPAHVRASPIRRTDTSVEQHAVFAIRCSRVTTAARRAHRTGAIPVTGEGPARTVNAGDAPHLGTSRV